MLTRPGLIFLTSSRVTPAGSFGRRLAISRVTSSYFLATSTSLWNSTWTTDNESSALANRCLTSSISFSASSIGSVTWRSISSGSAPG